MAALAYVAGIYFIITGLLGKGRAFKSKIGTPLTGKEAKTVRYLYIGVGAALIVVGVVYTIKMFI